MVVELDADYLILASIGTGATLAVVAEQDCEIERVGYESAVLAQQCAAVLSPAMVERCARPCWSEGAARGALIPG